MNKNWEVGQKVLFKLPSGDKLCEVLSSYPSRYGLKRKKSHYVTLRDLTSGEIIYSAYDENLIHYEVNFNDE